MLGGLPQYGLPTYSWPTYSIPEAGIGTPPPPAHTDAAGIEDWTRIWILKPDRTLGIILDDFAEAQFDILAFHQGFATIRFHKDSKACALTYEGATALEDEFVNYGVNFYYRDPGDGSRKRFMGIAGPRTKGWEGSEDASFITVTFIDALRHFLRNRQVLTTLRTRYIAEDEAPDNIMRDLIAKQLMAGQTQDPSGITWDRTRFGPSTDPWTVTVEAVKATPDHPETMDYYLDHGTNLNEAVMELCVGQVPDTGTPCALWPEISEGSPGNFYITVLYGRTGVGRAVGNTRTDKVFAPERDAVTAFEKFVDTEAQANCIAIRGATQGGVVDEEYIHDTPSYEKYGALENSWRIPEATTPDELMWEARLHLNLLKDGIATYEVTIRECEGMMYGEDVVEGDTIVISSGQASFNETAEKDLLGVRVTIPAPGWPKVEFICGQFQRNPIGEGRRFSGGGGKSGGGGRPSKKIGDPERCDDTYRIFYDDEGNAVIAQGCGNEVTFEGVWNVPGLKQELLVRTDATEVDGSAGELGHAACDKMLMRVVGTYDPTPVECIGRIIVYTGNAGWVWVPAIPIR